LAIVYKKSLPWFQLKRCAGGGIPFSKEGRTILYKKQDAMDYFSKQFHERHHQPLTFSGFFFVGV
jgi:hypothetical protein